MASPIRAKYNKSFTKKITIILLPDKSCRITTQFRKALTRNDRLITYGMRGKQETILSLVKRTLK